MKHSMLWRHYTIESLRWAGFCCCCYNSSMLTVTLFWDHAWEISLYASPSYNRPGLLGVIFFYLLTRRMRTFWPIECILRGCRIDYLLSWICAWTIPPLLMRHLKAYVATGSIKIKILIFAIVVFLQKLLRRCLGPEYESYRKRFRCSFQYIFTCFSELVSGLCPIIVM